MIEFLQTNASASPTASCDTPRKSYTLALVSVLKGYGIKRRSIRW